MNGWVYKLDNSVNTVDFNWFGFRVGKFANGNLLILALYIDDKVCGWSDVYNPDSSLNVTKYEYWLV